MRARLRSKKRINSYHVSIPILANNVPAVQPSAKAGGASAVHASRSAQPPVSAPTVDKVTISPQALQASQQKVP